MVSMPRGAAANGLAIGSHLMGPAYCTGRSVAQLRPSHERPLRIVTTQLRPNHELRIWEVQIQNLRILSSGQTTSGSQRLHRTATPLESPLEPPRELPQELPGLPPRGLQTRLFGRSVPNRAAVNAAVNGRSGPTRRSPSAGGARHPRSSCCEHCCERSSCSGSGAAGV